MQLAGRSDEIDISETTIAALKLAWPRKDIDVELAKMHLWLLGVTKARRPVYMLRFIKGWLGRCADKPIVIVNRRRDNIDQLTGRYGHTAGVDGTPFFPSTRVIRQQDDGDVG